MQSWCIVALSGTMSSWMVETQCQQHMPLQHYCGCRTPLFFSKKDPGLALADIVGPCHTLLACKAIQASGHTSNNAHQLALFPDQLCTAAAC